MPKRRKYFDKTKKTEATQSQSAKSASDAKKFKFDDVKLSANMKGFLITYNCKYTFCLNEAKKLIQQFSLADDNNKDKEILSTSESEDIEKLINEELNSINKRDKEFSVLDTGAKYTIFINFESVNPNSVVEAIFESIESSKKPLGRYVQRLLPVLRTCKAHLDDMEACLIATLDKEPAIIENENKPFSYCFIFNHSNNTSITRDSVFKMAGAYIQSKNKLNKVEFNTPDYVLFIQIICNMCYISFLRNYFVYRKYNLIEMGAKFQANKQSVPPTPAPTPISTPAPTPAPTPVETPAPTPPPIKINEQPNEKNDKEEHS